MPIPENLKKEVEGRVKDFFQKQLPKINTDMVRLSYKFRGNNLTIFEERRSFHNPSDPDEWTPFPVAQMRYDPKEKDWTLYQLDRNDKWFMYLDAESTPNIEDLLEEIDEDPTGIFSIGVFWG
ncbi:MAG: DUF3024 domain-containing protein [Candidatus Zixiibacteriota bacterium]